MRWVFFCLLILNVVYLVWGLVTHTMPTGTAALNAAPEEEGVHQLVLLSEAGVTQGYTVPENGNKESLCATLGPWSKRGQAAAELSALAAKGYQGTVQAVDVVKDHLHWVYLPAYPDRDAALKTLRELQARGVDSFIVADGDDANAISLGYFSSADSARGLMVKMKSAGYPAQIRESDRTETEYWIYFSTNGIPDQGVALRQALADNSKLSGRNVACRAPAPAADQASPEPSAGDSGD